MEILKCLCLEKDKLNNTGNELQIDYACGWAISEDYKESTLQILFDRADSYMYENKQLCKKQNQWVKADTIITADAVYLSLPVRYCALSGVCISQ